MSNEHLVTHLVIHYCTAMQWKGLYLHLGFSDSQKAISKEDLALRAVVTHVLDDCPVRAGLIRRVFGWDDSTLREALGDRTRLVELRRRLGRL